MIAKFIWYYNELVDYCYLSNNRWQRYILDGSPIRWGRWRHIVLAKFSPILQTHSPPPSHPWNAHLRYFKYPEVQTKWHDAFASNFFSFWRRDPTLVLDELIESPHPCHAPVSPPSSGLDMTTARPLPTSSSSSSSSLLPSSSPTHWRSKKTSDRSNGGHGTDRIVAPPILPRDRCHRCLPPRLSPPLPSPH